MDKIVIVRIGQLLRLSMVDLWEDQRRERGGLRGGGRGMFGENRGIVCNACAVVVS